MIAAHQLPAKPTAPASASASEVLGLVRVQQAVDRLVAGDAGADEDREHDGEAGPALGARAAQGEGDRERDRGGGVAEVVDEVGEQRDAARGDEDDELGDRGRAEDEQREADGAQALARALDRLVDEAVAVAWPCAWPWSWSWSWSCGVVVVVRVIVRRASSCAIRSGRPRSAPFPLEALEARGEPPHLGDEVALGRAVDDLELDAVGVVEEDRVVARRVVVLLGPALDLRALARAATPRARRRPRASTRRTRGGAGRRA